MTENLPEQRRPSPLVEFKRDLKRLKEAGELDMLPSNVSFEAFKNAAVVAVTDNPKILQCETQSVFKAVRRLAAAGLVPDGREAALVPFKTKVGSNYIDVCQAMPMVLGLIKVARNSGEVTDVRAHIIYQAEVDQGRFVYVAGDDEQITHDPILFGEKGEPVGAYAIAKMKDGSTIREVMDKARIDRARRSGASQLEFPKGGGRPSVSADPKGIWATWWEDMWKKTVIRAMIKRLPMSAEDMRRIADLDEARHEMKDITPEPAKPRQNLAQRLTEAPEPPESHDGEVLPPEDEDAAPEGPHWTEEIPHDGAFPGNDEYGEGAKAFSKGKPYVENPYADDPDKAVDWAGGWIEAKRAKE